MHIYHAHLCIYMRTIISRTLMHIYANNYTYTYKYIYIHTYIYTHTYTIRTSGSADIHRACATHGSG